MFQKLRTDLTRKLRLIRLLIINADMFPTESSISCSRNLAPNNGHGVADLRALGIKSAAFSRRKSESLSAIVTNRLGIELFHQGVSQKSVIYSKFKTANSVLDKEIALMSGDISDLSIIERVNFAVAPADAPVEVKAKCYYVTYGIGEEAVREVVGLILKARNHPNGLSE